MRNETFSRDLADLFARRRCGHMGHWEYDVPDGPRLWQEFLGKHPEYYLPREELEVIDQAVSHIGALIQGPVSIVSLGPGSLVRKDLALAKAFQTASFHIVEGASDSLRLSRAEVECANPEWLVTAHQGDFYELLPPTPARPVATLFGQTLFNLEGPASEPPDRSLKTNLEALRRPGQLLIVAQDSTQDSDKIEAAYRGQNEFALNVLKQAGLDHDAFGFDVEWHPESHCLAHYFTKGPARWHFNSSWKLPKDRFLDIADQAGYRLIESYSKNGMALSVLEG